MMEPPLYRYLILHPESDCYFEIHCSAPADTEYEHALADGLCVDVTGEPEHEALFQLYKAQK